MLPISTFEVMGGVSLLAGFVSGIAGASGMVILPALLMAGMSPHFALGTARLYTTTSLLTSALYYIKNRRFRPGYWIPAILSAMMGAIIGVSLTFFVSIVCMQKLLPILIMLISIYMLIPFKKVGGSSVQQKGSYAGQVIVGMLLGIYSGFVGAGTGSIWTSAATEVFKVDIIEASAISRFMCFVTNLVSLVVFMCLNKVDYTMGLFLAFFGVIGALVGSRFAICLGAKFIRYIVIGASIIMAGNLIFL